MVVNVEPFAGRAMGDQPLEVVERKGTGHPDTICDALCDSISVALCGEYLKRFGEVLHHNIDKALLSAGTVSKNFGGGEMTMPMKLFIGDRATLLAGGERIAVDEIAVETARKWFQEHMRFVDPHRHVRFEVLLGKGSEELSAIFHRPGLYRSANDTSAAVGFYPLTPTESMVLELERHLNSYLFKNEFPETGEDVKVMAFRQGHEIEVTVAMPLMAVFTGSEKHYFQKKDLVHQEIKKWLRAFLPSHLRLRRLNLNALDAAGMGMEGVYLSLLGTSAEDADSGQVGRGNRVNGLISVARPLGTEAAAGKNPVSHVGKIYNVLSHKLAKEIYERVDGLNEAYVFLVSRIGDPVNEPAMVNVQVALQDGVALVDVLSSIEEILEEGLLDINALCTSLAEGRWPIC